MTVLEIVVHRNADNKVTHVYSGKEKEEEKNKDNSTQYTDKLK